MHNAYQLPDYLPSIYQNWYAFYIDVILLFHNKLNGQLTDDTPIRLTLVDEGIIFYQEWPYGIIRQRAYDYLTANNNV